MNVHAGSVVVEQWLRHEGRGLAVLVRNIFDDVLELQKVVGRLDQRVKAIVNLTLSGSSNLVVASFDAQSGIL